METSFHVRSFDATVPLEEFRALPRSPVYIVLDNLRSAFNVGSIFRLCDTMRAAELILCGYTAFPPHVKLEKTSLGTIDYVPWRHFDSAVDAVASLQEAGIAVYCAETASGSTQYADVDYPAPVALVFGNEALGVSAEVLAMADMLIEIPALGFKNSLNVATAVSVIGYRALEQMQKKGLAPKGPVR
jgi:tRNA G18 (ribose-2'-O)-methylase SpoU